MDYIDELRRAKVQTPEICMLAVKQNGLTLRFVEKQTPEICLAAVRQSGYALKYVKEQTPEICLAAVRQSGRALRYVKEQTPEICLAAIKQNGYALDCVKEQTPEICLAAVKRNSTLLSHVKIPALVAYIEEPDAPKVDDIHNKIYDATSDSDLFTMYDWHVDAGCGTAHCWAGWIVHIAGAEGYQLEADTSTAYAALAILHKSDPTLTETPNFFSTNEEAREAMLKLTERVL